MLHCTYWGLVDAWANQVAIFLCMAMSGRSHALHRHHHRRHHFLWSIYLAALLVDQPLLSHVLAYGDLASSCRTEHIFHQNVPFERRRCFVQATAHVVPFSPSVSTLTFNFRMSRNGAYTPKLTAWPQTCSRVATEPNNAIEIRSDSILSLNASCSNSYEHGSWVPVTYEIHWTWPHTYWNQTTYSS
jgi:hypothetical protein